MPEVDVNETAVAESVGFLSFFKDLSDPRQRGKIVYPLAEVLLLILMAVMAECDTIVDIADFGQDKIDLLRKLRPFEHGTPSHDQLCNILAWLDPVVFQRCFVNWVASITKTATEVIAIDGKTVRRSYSKKSAQDPIHVVSAFAARQRLVLGQVKVEDKSNEIVAIPALLQLLHIEGAIVTIDAMGCQREIAKQIVDQKADYILALKGNQGTLREDVELFVDEQKASNFKDTQVTQHETTEADHGRIETRKVTVIHDIEWLQKRHNWPGLASVVMVESRRELDAKVETETRFYISSLTRPAEQLGPMIRSHWAIENSHHWILDVAMDDDLGRLRTQNAPHNFATVKAVAKNLIMYRKNPKISFRRTRKRMDRSDDLFISFLNQ